MASPDDVPGHAGKIFVGVLYICIFSDAARGLQLAVLKAYFKYGADLALTRCASGSGERQRAIVHIRMAIVRARLN